MANGAEDDPLVIRDLTFLGGIATPRGWRPATTLPEIAFSGRSNVGKSSLLNTLVRRKALARVSQTPGKTREINFYGVNDAFTLVDLPGYGYAQISKREREQWRPLIEGYLRTSEQLRGVVQLIDARHDPSALDTQMLAFLADLGAPTVVALTKVDKLQPSERAARLERTVQQLELDEEQVIPFSSVTREGRDDLARAIVSLVQQPSWRTR
ncbi:MAG TPA: ribosome biogenesis GTP-binding protein YihA/YsxC [Gemmatimonadaceae bacterium]|nr:ribosome biogenesis GTP-binding protein YihA/YsxC [Gemmatimonadaceae bacterium]